MPPVKRTQKKRKPTMAGPIEKDTLYHTKTTLQNTEPENINILGLVEGTAASIDAVSMAREVYHKFSDNEQFRKTIKITNCMKYMNIEVHPQLMKEWYMEALPPLAETQGVHIVETSAQSFRTVGFSRSLPRQLVADQEKVVKKKQCSQPSPVISDVTDAPNYQGDPNEVENCDKPVTLLKVSSGRESSLRFLYILPAGEVASRLQSRALASHMAGRRRALRGQITLLVLDCDHYFKKGKPKHDLEMAITDLLVTLGIDTLRACTPEGLAAVVLQFTKAVAEEPIKLAKRTVDEQAEFYMRGDNKNCVTVDQNGNGSSRLWQQMLSVLPQSSLEVSRAIAAAFPGPRLLADALSTEAGASQLADIGVARSGVPGARPRRLGPEMANKLRALFTERDGDVVVE